MVKRTGRWAWGKPVAGALLLAAAALQSPDPADGKALAVVTDAAIVSDGDRTRFVLSADRAVEFHVFALADPYRVILDMQEVDFKLPERAGEAGDGLIQAFRFGLFSAGRSRIVIETTGPVQMAEPEIHPPKDDRPAQLVVSLSGTSENRFLNEIALNGPAREETAVAASRPAAIAPMVEPPSNAKPVVVIDPGHGGIDSGARSASGVFEKEIVLEFGRALAEKLRSTGQYKVVMTRTGDSFVSLSGRRAVARQHKADLFVSIHADSIRQSKIRGATVYTLSEKASDEESAALAEQENKADEVAGVVLEEYSSEVGDILKDLADRATKNNSKDFAKRLVKSLRGKIGLNRNPTRSAGFVVLKEPYIPSVLLELGYLSNQQDERAMRSDNWRDKASDSIARAIGGFFATRLAGAN